MVLMNDSMKLASERLENEWFEMMDKVIVFTSVFAVDRDDYVKTFERVKKLLISIQSEFESAKKGPADTLILYNVQFGPIVPKRPF